VGAIMDRALIEEIKNKNNLIDVAKELLVVDAKGFSGSSYIGNCPKGHPSNSGRSFNMNPLYYYCFNCGIGGDLIRFVQEFKFGGITKETFFLSLKFLAERVGIILADTGEKYCHEEYENTKTALEILCLATEFYHQSLTVEHREWLKRRYGLTEETISKFKIGYSNGDCLFRHLHSKGGYTKEQALLSGLFTKYEVFDGLQLKEFFQHRIVFPYFRHNQVSYMIGRKTDKTPTSKFENGKYKKLLTFNEEKNRTYISRGIQNDIIFNQDILFKAKEVIITEGVTDCIALSQYGFHSISPVTIRFTKKDVERIVRILNKDQIIYICNDNEFNQAGASGAYDTALELSLKGFNIKLITIPLEDKHNDARKRLEALRK
jgi:DNA primase